MNLYQLNSRRGVKEWVTIATLVPEGDILNSCTRSPTNALTRLKFLAPTNELLGTTNVKCIRGGKWESTIRSESKKKLGKQKKISIRKSLIVAFCTLQMKILCADQFKASTSPLRETYGHPIVVRSPGVGRFWPLLGWGGELNRKCLS